jgi:hypothetical protein
MSYEKPLTLRELHARLGEIIAEHDKRGWSERNDAPVYARVEQPKTPSGRLRPDHFIPIHFGCSSLTGFWLKENDASSRVDAITVLASRTGKGWPE